MTGANLHILMNGVQFASRVLNETDTLARSGMFDHVYIAGLRENGLPELERVDDRRTIWRAPLRTKRWSRSLPVQLIKYAEFFWRMVRYARSKPVATVNVHSLAILPVGVMVKWLCGAKLVYDAHELETEIYGLDGVRQTLSRLVERALIRQSDLLIVVGDGINDWYRRRYDMSNTVTVMNCPRARSPQRTRPLHESLGIPAERKILIYQGMLAPGRGIEGVLRAFAGLRSTTHALVFMGDGPLDKEIQRFAAQYPNIYLQPAVDPSVVLEYTASASVGIAYIDNPSMNDRLCLPNKFFEYIMAGLPVIVNDAPEVKAIVEQHKIGIVLSELSAASLGQGLDRISQMDHQQLTANLHNAAAEFCWERQAVTMLDAYKTHVLNGRATTS